MSNLNESQKHLLRWMVNEAWNGNLDENEISISWDFDGTDVKGYTDEVLEIKKTSLEALETEGYLICHKKKQGYVCSLTAKAYEAVENNFSINKIERDDSFTDYLNGLNNLGHLDEKLKNRCLYSISNSPEDPEAWDKAIRTATVILEDRVREIGETEKINPDATGDTIVNLTFGQNSKFAQQLGDKKAKAYRDLYAGLMLVFRNRYNHRLVDPTPEDGAAILQFINLTLKMLDDINK